MSKKTFACSIQLLKKILNLSNPNQPIHSPLAKKKNPLLWHMQIPRQKTPNKFKLPDIQISNVEYFKISYKTLAFNFFVMNFA
jgi:hypothetical protein